MREILDGLPPELLRPLLPTLCEKIRRTGWAREFTSLVPSGEHQGEYSTVMLDGTDSFHSTRVQCPGCLQRVDASGEVHFRHTVVAATRVKAGSHRVWPLEVEEVRNSDGQAKQDCELHAAQRLLPRLREEHPQMPLIVGGDDLYAHEPFIAQLRAHRLHHVCVCKPGSHTEVYKWVDDLARRGACEVGQWDEGPACRRRFFAYRVARQIPLTTTRRIWCTFVEVWERDRTGKLLYHNAWVTDLAVDSHNVCHSSRTTMRMLLVASWTQFLLRYLDEAGSSPSSAMVQAGASQERPQAEPPRCLQAHLVGVIVGVGRVNHPC